MELDHNHEPIATLDEGGSGLGRDIHDRDTKPFKLDGLTQALVELHGLKVENDRLAKRCQWLTLGLFVAFGLGIVFALKVLA